MLPKAQINVSSKKELANYSQSLKKDLMKQNPLEVAALLKAMEELAKGLRGDKELKKFIWTEAEKYEQSTIDFDKFKISKSVRNTPDFSSCNDTVRDELVSEIEELKERLKMREAALVAGVHPETGKKLPKPEMKQTPTISVSLK